MGQMVAAKTCVYLLLVNMTLLGGSIIVNIIKDPEMLAKGINLTTYVLTGG